MKVHFTLNDNGICQALVTINNNEKLSIVTGLGTMTSADSPYEIATLYNDEIDHDSIIGYLTAPDIVEYLEIRGLRFTM